MNVLNSSIRCATRAIAIAGIFAISIQAICTQSSKNAEAAGATLFRDKGCAYCHGANTQGTLKGPSLVNVRKAKNATQIAAQIKNGGQKMPSFEDVLSPIEIDQLVAYLRAKYRPAPAPLAKPAVEAPAVVPPAQ